MTRVIGAAAVWGAVLLALGGCYTLQPVATMPPLGSRVGLDLTDAGRVALGGRMGPAILQIEGRLIDRTDGADGAQYDIAVSMVHLLGGGEQVWSGERVQVRQEYIARTYDRQFSQGRTVVASAVGIGVVTYFATRAIAGFVSGRQDPGSSGDSTGVSLRAPVRP